MPAVTLPAAPRTCCFVCKSSGNPRLQHRRVCRDRRSTVREQGQLRESDANELILISRWLDHWNRSLFCWGAFAANLVHQSPNYLQENWFDEIDEINVYDKMIFDLVGEDEMDDSLRSFKHHVATHDTLRIVINLRLLLQTGMLINAGTFFYNFILLQKNAFIGLVSTVTPQLPPFFVSFYERFGVLQVLVPCNHTGKTVHEQSEIFTGVLKTLDVDVELKNKLPIWFHIAKDAHLWENRVFGKTPKTPKQNMWFY
ncbi:hypothetical protein B0H13DRAFT_1851439 [Mycena leptocephala]|nr:hypothetical protein B0H13DRAFT_1851439 [Mycena leptocephala]